MNAGGAAARAVSAPDEAPVEPVVPGAAEADGPGGWRTPGCLAAGDPLPAAGTFSASLSISPRIGSLGPVPAVTVVEPKRSTSEVPAGATAVAVVAVGAAPAAGGTGAASERRGVADRACTCWVSCSIWAASARTCVSSPSSRTSAAPPPPPSERAPPEAAAVAPPRASNSSVPMTTCISTSCSSSCSTRCLSPASPAAPAGGAALRAAPGTAGCAPWRAGSASAGRIATHAARTGAKINGKVIRWGLDKAVPT